MTSRREAIVSQREERLENMRQRMNGVRTDIHRSTQITLQSILLDKLLAAESRKARNFAIKSSTLKLKSSDSDAQSYLVFFQRCVGEIWTVALAPSRTGYVYEFVRA